MFKFKQHKSKLPLINFDKYLNDNKKLKISKRHSELLPNNIRSIVCGPSNSGKTNTVFNLLFAQNGVKFSHLNVFTKSHQQDKYQLLKKIMEQIPEIKFNLYKDNDEIPHPNDADQNSVMIFDDISMENQQNIRNYFSMGRHNKIDCFYICQTYSSIPKQLIRDNCNLVVAFKQDNRNLQHIYHDHVYPDMSRTEFNALCTQAWKKNNNEFLVINKECATHNGRYRFGFDRFITI